MIDQPTKIQVLTRAAAEASVIAERCESIPQRLGGDPLMLIRMLSEISIGVVVLAEVVRDVCQELAVEGIAAGADGAS